METVITTITMIGLGLLSFCLGLYRLANGSQRKLKEEIDKRVSRDACHEAMRGLEDRFEDQKKYICGRFDDLKSFIKDNNK